MQKYLKVLLELNSNSGSHYHARCNTYKSLYHELRKYMSVHDISGEKMYHLLSIETYSVPEQNHLVTKINRP